MKKYITIGIIVVLVLLFGTSGCSTYNKMVVLDQSVQQQWAKVEVQYQRRMDLIPNMVETVKGYAAHESSTYENVTKARTGLSDAYNAAKDAEAAGSNPGNATDFARYNDAQQALNRALSIYVNAVREAYPDLKADTQFANLQTVLEGTENRIGVARQNYNTAAMEYNRSIRRFPTNILAGMFGFDRKPLFEANEGSQNAPTVEF